jgi:hypothetical protein
VRATLWALLLVLAIPRANLGQPAALTRASLDDAIAWGVLEDPQPYPLRSWSRPGVVGSGRLGAIYTPFLRVALASKAARLAGRPFDASHVPSAWVEPVVYVAFRWYRVNEDPATFNPFAYTDQQIAGPNLKPPTLDPALRILTDPLWVSRDLTLLAPFGELPYQDIIVIAAYPLSALTSGHDFVIYREWLEPGHLAPSRHIRAGRVLPEEVRRWR